MNRSVRIVLWRYHLRTVEPGDVFSIALALAASVIAIVIATEKLEESIFVVEIPAEMTAQIGASPSDSGGGEIRVRVPQKPLGLMTGFAIVLLVLPTFTLLVQVYLKFRADKTYLATVFQNFNDRLNQAKQRLVELDPNGQRQDLESLVARGDRYVVETNKTLLVVKEELVGFLETVLEVEEATTAFEESS